MSTPSSIALVGRRAAADRLRCCLLLLACNVHGGALAQPDGPMAKMPAAARPLTEPMQPLLLRMPLSRHAQLVFQPRPWQEPGAPALAAAQASVGLEFKSTRPTDGARSLLRVQLSRDSTLQFRPRGGGLTVTYRSQF